MKKRIKTHHRKQRPPSHQSFWRFYTLLAVGLIIFGGSALALKEAWYYVRDPAHFPVKNVDIDGQLSHLQQSDIEASIRPSLSAGFLALPVDQISQHLSQLPWLKTVTIHRKWPNTLMVTLQEQQPIAEWNHNALINIQGQLFVPDPSSFPKDLAQLVGPTDKFDQVFALFQQASSILSIANIGRLQQLTLDKQGNWLFKVANITVMLGSQNIIPRLMRFASAYPKLVAKGVKIHSVDMRYSLGLAVS